MICPRYFVSELVKRNVRMFSGIPCSYLTTVINEVMQREDTRYVMASNEGEALAIASGVWLGGKIATVMCQNSGLGNMVNPLTSLSAPFGIPTLLLITWRGKPGETDEPQHEIMGRITTDLLTLMGIEWKLLPKEKLEVSRCLDVALSTIKESNKPYAIILEKDSFFSEPTLEKISEKNKKRSFIMNKAPIKLEAPRREDILRALLDHIPSDSILIATTGKTGRELYTLQDNDNHLYCVGSMGYANALAHGLALTTTKKIFVLDGDGAVIMHLGNLTSIGASQIKNLVHIILDNGAYDSTGGQGTVSSFMDFTAIAKAVGYTQAINCLTLKEFITAITEMNNPGPLLIYIKISRGSMKQLGRPSITPYTVARRLRNFIEKENEKKNFAVP